MKFLTKSGLLACAFLMASCSLIGREAGYPGGNLGYAADRKILFAQGHDQRVQRYLVSMAILSPLIAETASTPIEAKLSAERIDAMYDKLLVLKIASDRCRLSHVDSNWLKLDLNKCEIGDKGLQESALSFESVSFDVAKSLNDALKQAYDNLNLRQRITNVTALSPSGILRTVLRARHLLPIAMKYFATYRDVTAILSASVLESCVAQKSTFDLAKKERLVGVTGEEVIAKIKAEEFPLFGQCQAAGKLVSDYLRRARTEDANIARQERPIRDIYKASQALTHSGLDWQLTRKHVAALIYHVDRACNSLFHKQGEEATESNPPKDCRLSASKSAAALLKEYPAE